MLPLSFVQLTTHQEYNIIVNSWSDNPLIIFPKRYYVADSSEPK